MESSREIVEIAAFEIENIRKFVELFQLIIQ